jgi:cytochrome oxidase Cu insertion factor (SCO1/SenC/PrrC family)
VIRSVSLLAAAFALAPPPYVPALSVGDTLSDTALVDQGGRDVSIAGFRGETLVMTFAYTHCPDTKCALASAKFARLQRLVRRESIHLLEVTLDPRRDTPPVLARYGAVFGADRARWTLATGRPAAVLGLAARAGIRTAAAGGGIAHDDAVTIVDPSGRIAAVIEGDAWTPDDVARNARAVNGGAALDAMTRARIWLGSAAAICGGRGGPTVAAALALFAAILAAAGVAARRLFAERDAAFRWPGP